MSHCVTLTDTWVVAEKLGDAVATAPVPMAVTMMTLLPVCASPLVDGLELPQAFNASMPAMSSARNTALRREPIACRYFFWPM